MRQELEMIFNPKWWWMNTFYNEKLDREILELLKTHKLRFEKGYLVAHLGHLTLWVGNYPYGYGTTFLDNLPGRPSRKTIYKLKQRERLDRLSLEDLRDLKIKELLN